jgi:hypothetical protein
LLWFLAAAGCSGTVTVGQTSVAIDSPTQLETVAPGTDPLMSVPITFTVKNFTLKDTCGAASGCGHVVVLVDHPIGSNLTGCITFGYPYNNKGSASPIDAHFSRCQTGSHSIRLELHHDDETAELDQNNNPVSSDTINITLGIPDGGP